MAMKKVVLFDLDNTLYEYEPVHKKSLEAVYRILSKEIKISKKEFLRLFKISRAEIGRELAGTASSHNRVLYFQRLVEKSHNTIEPEVILKLYNAYWDTFLKNIKLRKGVIQTLRKLKQLDIKTAIVSDLTTHIQLRKMSKLGITPYIHILVTSEEAGSEKPNNVMFLLALNKLNVLPSEAVMVGDNPVNDIEGGNAVGLDTVLITSKKSTEFHFSENYQKPNYTIEEIPEILDFLESKR
jgi:putative hydrolase of the HAD superfamily